MSKRTIKSIHFYNDHLIADYGDGKTFQLCRACKNRGRHLRAFLSLFCPTFDFSIMNEATTVAMERKLYKTFAHGDLRRFVNKEAYAFGTYLEKRFTPSIKKQKKTAEVS